MKSIKFILPLVALVGVSCQEETTSLSKLQDERDSLTELSTTVQERLLEIEGEIAVLDSSLRYTTVSIQSLEVRPFAHYFQVYGSVEADRNVTLFAESSGMIENIYVREGQTVKEGQKLVQLDDEIIRNNIEEVETSLELAKTLYEKQTSLWNQNIGSEVQYLEAKNRYESLETRLATLQSQLRMSNLTAPFTGIVDEIFPKTGEYAAPGSRLIRLLNMSQVYVTADVPESYVNRVKSGSEVELYFSAIQDTVSAKIIQVGQFINPDNRTFKIKIGIDDASGSYKPNMMSSVTIRDYEADSAVVLPSRMIQQNQLGESFVYVFEPTEGELGMVVKKKLDCGISYNGYTEVRAGLTGSEQVVDRGARSVQDGEKVRVVE